MSNRSYPGKEQRAGTCFIPSNLAPPFEICSLTKRALWATRIWSSTSWSLLKTGFSRFLFLEVLSVLWNDILKDPIQLKKNDVVPADTACHGNIFACHVNFWPLLQCPIYELAKVFFFGLVLWTSFKDTVALKTFYFFSFAVHLWPALTTCSKLAGGLQENEERMRKCWEKEEMERGGERRQRVSSSPSISSFSSCFMAFVGSVVKILTYTFWGNNIGSKGLDRKPQNWCSHDLWLQTGSKCG